jgi:hypothetical protein
LLTCGVQAHSNNIKARQWSATSCILARNNQIAVCAILAEFDAGFEKVRSSGSAISQQQLSKQSPYRCLLLSMLPLL